MVLTDEDSGEESVISINNLPGSQLRAPAEINVPNEEIENSSSDSEDNIPLSELARKYRTKTTKKKKKTHHWVKEDLPKSQLNTFEDAPAESISKSPLEWFSIFFL